MNIIPLNERAEDIVLPPSASEPPSIWCVVANVICEPHTEGSSEDLRLGTKRFAPGAKLYCFPLLWGDGGERLTVYGRHRGAMRLITAVVATKWLTNWRVKRVFNPAVVARMESYWDDSEESREQAEKIVAMFTKTR